MSAQIIAALRKRAKALEDEAANPALAYTIDEHGVAKDPASLRWLASEFRALADAAERRERFAARFPGADPRSSSAAPTGR